MGSHAVSIGTDGWAKTVQLPAEQSPIKSQMRLCQAKCLMILTILTGYRTLANTFNAMSKLIVPSGTAVSGASGLRQIRRKRRSPGDFSALHLVHGDVIGFERDAQRLIQSQAGGAVSHRRPEGRPLRGDYIALLKRDVVGRGGAQAEALFSGVEKLLLQLPILDRRV